MSLSLGSYSSAVPTIPLSDLQPRPSQAAELPSSLGSRQAQACKRSWVPAILSS